MNFRKIARATWALPSSSLTYGELDLDLLPEHHSSPLPTVVFRMAKAIEQVPEINVWTSLWGVIPRPSIDITIVVHVTPGNLQFVTLKHCNEKTEIEIAQEIQVRSKLLRNGSPGELAPAQQWVHWTPAWILPILLKVYNFLDIDCGISLAWIGLPHRAFGSVVISNIGTFGLKKAFLPMIPLARAQMMVAIGQTSERIILENEKIKTVKYVPLSFSFDHRVIDGYHAGKMAKIFKN